MKRLIFVRHGRAEELPPQITDIERTLTTKGKVVSRQMAIRLKDQNIIPDIYISSHAFRALETALIFAKEFEHKTDKILIRNILYFNINFNTLSELLSELSDDSTTVILFGHNPSFTELPDRLCRTGCDFLPKSGIVSLVFKTDSWKDLIRERGKQEFFMRPEKTS